MARISRKKVSLKLCYLSGGYIFNYSCIFYAITSLPEIYIILSYLIFAYSPESSESPESLLCQNHQKHYNQQNCQNQSGFKVTLLHLWDFLCCAFLNVSTNGLQKNFHFYLNFSPVQNWHFYFRYRNNDMSSETQGVGGRGLGRQQLNCLINTYLIKQNLNKFSVVFVKQMVY